MEKQNKQLLPWLKKSLASSASITISAITMILGSWLLDIAWLGHVAGAVLLINVALNIFAFQQALSDEEIERQARVLARMFIKMHLSKHGETTEEDDLGALRAFLEEENSDNH